MPIYTSSQKQQIAQFVSFANVRESVAAKVSVNVIILPLLLGMPAAPIRVNGDSGLLARQVEYVKNCSC